MSVTGSMSTNELLRATRNTRLSKSKRRLLETLKNTPYIFYAKIYYNNAVREIPFRWHEMEREQRSMGLRRALLPFLSEQDWADRVQHEDEGGKSSIDSEFVMDLFRRRPVCNESIELLMETAFSQNDRLAERQYNMNNRKLTDPRTDVVAYMRRGHQLQLSIGLVEFCSLIGMNTGELYESFMEMVHDNMLECSIEPERIFPQCLPIARIGLGGTTRQPSLSAAAAAAAISDDRYSAKRKRDTEQQRERRETLPIIRVLPIYLLPLLLQTRLFRRYTLPLYENIPTQVTRDIFTLAHQHFLRNSLEAKFDVFSVSRAPDVLFALQAAQRGVLDPNSMTTDRFTNHYLESFAQLACNTDLQRSNTQMLLLQRRVARMERFFNVIIEESCSKKHRILNDDEDE